MKRNRLARRLLREARSLAQVRHTQYMLDITDDLEVKRIVREAGDLAANSWAEWPDEEYNADPGPGLTRVIVIVPGVNHFIFYELSNLLRVALHWRRQEERQEAEGEKLMEEER